MTYDEFMSAINSDVERILDEKMLLRACYKVCQKVNLAYQKNNFKSSETP